VPVDTSTIGDMCCATEMLSGVSTFRARRVVMRCTFAFGFADETIRIFRVTDLLVRFAILLADYFYALTFWTIFK
jgi:hypothetical protein